MSSIEELILRVRAGLHDAEDKARAAKSASPYPGWWYGPKLLQPHFPDQETAHIAAWSPETVLATVTVLRDLVDGAEDVLIRHEPSRRYQGTLRPPLPDPGCARCETSRPCPDQHFALYALEAVSRLPFIGGDTK